MAIKLKQSTASQEVPLGFFVDSTDGNTEETGLTIANTDIKLWKMGATTLANKNSGGATHISNGVYYCVLDATDTNTLGAMKIYVHVAGALPVAIECEVLAANIYDSWIAGTDILDVSTTQFNGTAVTAASGRPEVNMTHISGSAVSTTTAQIGANVVQVSGDGTAADNLELAYDGTGYVGGTIKPQVDVVAISGDTAAADALETAFDGTAGPVPELGIIDRGTAQQVTGTTIRFRSGFSATNDVMIGATVWVPSSTNGLHERRVITDWDNTSKDATVDTWTQTPTGTILYVCFATPPASVGAPAAVNVVQLLGTAVATPTVAGVMEVDVTHFGGTAATTSSGRPEVNTTHAAGTAWNSGAIGANTLASGTITAAKYAGAAIDATALAASAASEIAAAVWDLTISGHTTVGTFGQAVTPVRSGTATGGAAGTITLDAGASAVDDAYNNGILFITGGTGVGQNGHTISDYNGTSKVASVTPNFTTTPDNTSVFLIIPMGAIAGATAPTAGEVADAVWTEVLADHSGTSGGAAERLARIPNVAAGGNGGLPTTDANNAVKVQSGTGANQISLSSGAVLLQATQTGVTIPTVTTVTNLTNSATNGDLTATMKTSIGTAVAASAVASVTGNVGGDVGGNVVGSVGSVTTVSDKTGYRLSSTGVDDIHDEVVDGSTTFRESTRLQNAALAGKVSGAGTGTTTFRDLADSKDRIVSTDDADGNRTTLTRDAS